MPTEPQDMSWKQLIKNWIVTFVSGLVKKPNNVLIFIIALFGLYIGNKADDKASNADGKATVAVSVAGEAKKEAGNKDLEQASYETLAATIAELQDKIDSVDERLTKLQNAPPAQVSTAIRVYTQPTAVSPASAAPPPPAPPVIEPPLPPPPSWNEVILKSNK